MLYFVDWIRAHLRLLMAGTSARAMGPALGAVPSHLHAVGAKTSVARTVAFMLSDVTLAPHAAMKCCAVLALQSSPGLN